MNIAMELHDSRILSLKCASDGLGEILFHAVTYYAKGIPGKASQVSGWQNVRMRFSGMSVEGNIGQIGQTQTDIYNGTLVTASKDCGGFFPVRGSYEGPIVLSMFLSNDGEYRDLVVRATTLRMSMEGEFTSESIWDNDGNITAVTPAE
jgi:hypothetical protein